MTLESLKIPADVAEAIDCLEAAGFEAWLVGGCVRDALLGREIHDFDIACAAPWEEAEAVLREAGFAVHRTGTAHGTVTVTKNNTSIEVTTYRIDGDYSDGRRPNSIEQARSIQEDLARRDFTINAMAYHPARGLLDIFNGVEDLQNRIIRTVGEPKKRFAEDGLRILRGCRFASQLGFSIEEATFRAMLKEKHMLLKVSVERTVHELDGLLLGENVVSALLETGQILSVCLPEITACFKFEQLNPYHIYDVWEHTARVVGATKPLRLNRWAALFHDVGKPGAFFAEETAEGLRGHFYGHALLSVDLAKGACSRLKLAPSFTSKLLTLVRIHDKQIAPTRKSVQRALCNLDGDVDLFCALLDLKQADARAHSDLAAPRLQTVSELEVILTEVLENKEPVGVKMLAITGNDVMSLGIEAGPAVGDALNRALDAVIDGEVANEKEALLEYLAAMG